GGPGGGWRVALPRPDRAPAVVHDVHVRQPGQGPPIRGAGPGLRADPPHLITGGGRSHGKVAWIQRATPLATSCTAMAVSRSPMILVRKWMALGRTTRARAAANRSAASTTASASTPPAATARRSTAPGCWRTRTMVARSEEHTSELQSPDHLVCRLLLEKQTRGQS